MLSGIDVGGVKPLVSRTEIQCGRPGNVRANAGKPTYKSQEEQYQEIQELRRSLGELREENSGLKTRSRRLEEDLVRRDRQIQQLMDPSKNDEARRKLTDKGASLVSSLKLRVSRLEATLKDKEAELAKLQASAKATAMNEMKIEAETYYQEVVRLRNQLNILQQQQQQHHHPQQHQQQSPPQYHLYPSNPAPPQQQQHLQPPEHKTLSPTHWSNMRGSGGRERDGGDGQESPTANLRHALTSLEEENTRLQQQLSSLVGEKEKLAMDLERVLGLNEEVKGNYEGLSRAELIREVERRHEEISRWEAQQSQLTEALARRTDLVGEGSALVQARVAELQGREVEWERERSSLHELIDTLKDDRVFYKETAEKKDTELENLRQEIQGLQQEVMSLHDAQRRRGDRAPGGPQQRFPRTHNKAGPPSSVSRSGSSSETNTPTRRTRPSSARPPAPGVRSQRHPKASSEPRELSPTNKHQRQPSKKPIINRSPSKTTTSSKPSSTQSSPSKAPGSVQHRSSSLASSTRKPAAAAPTTSRSHLNGSTKQSSSSRLSSAASSSSKSSTPSGSPRKTLGSTSIPSPRTKSAQSSPQHRVTGSVSPQLQGSGVASPGKASTSRSSSRTSTPSSSAKSTPHKTTNNRSPSKVPQPRVTGSPSKARKREEQQPKQPASPSPSRTPRSPHKQQSVSLKGSSTDRVKTAPSTPAPPLPCHKEEDERVLAELVFQRETDSSVDMGEAFPLTRQRTMTLTAHDQDDPTTQASSTTTLNRQNTVTLDKEQQEGNRDQEEVTCVPGGKEEAYEEQLVVVAGEEGGEPDTSGRELLPGTEMPAQDDKIIENVELLQCLLVSHLSRQREVNKLLSQEPLLVGEGQSEAGSPEAGRGRLGRGRQREAPDGEESSGGQGRSRSLVRQGTFNVYDHQPDQPSITALTATLAAHLSRATKVHQLTNK